MAASATAPYLIICFFMIVFGLHALTHSGAPSRHFCFVFLIILQFNKKTGAKVAPGACSGPAIQGKKNQGDCIFPYSPCSQSARGWALR